MSKLPTAGGGVRLLVHLLAIAALLASSHLIGQTPVPSFTSRLTGVEGLEVDDILCTRLQADGSRLVVARGPAEAVPRFYGAEPGPGLWAVRFDASGAVLSSVLLPGMPLQKYDEIRAACDSLGRISVLTVEPDPAVLLFDARTGARLWPAPSRLPMSGFRVSGTQESWSLAIDRGDVVVAGSGLAGASTLALFLLRLDGVTGNVVWGPNPVPRSVDAPTSDVQLRASELGVFVGGSAGFCADYVPCDPTILLARLDRENGQVLWETTSGPGRLDGLELDARGRIVALVAGTRSAPGSLHTRRAVDGASLWRRAFTELRPPLYSQRLLSFVDPSGHVQVAMTDNDGSQLARYDGSTGKLAWGPMTLPDFLEDLAADGKGSAISTSRAPGGLVVRKLEAGTGREMWKLQLPELGWPARQSRIRQALCVTPNGDPFVAAGGSGLAAVELDGHSGRPLRGPVFALDQAIPPAGHWGAPRVRILPGGDLLTSVYLALDGTVLLARLDRESGRTLWRSTACAAPEADASGNLYSLCNGIGSYGLSRLDPLTGAELFRSTIPDPQATFSLRLGFPADGTVRVIRGAWPESLEFVVLRTSDGSLLERHTISGTLTSEIDPASGDILTASLVGGGTVIVRRLDTRTGLVRWARTLPGTSIPAMHFAAQGRILVVDQESALGLDGATGQTVWDAVSLTESGERSNGQAVLDEAGNLLIPVSRGSEALLRRIDAMNGSVLWGARLLPTLDGRFECWIEASASLALVRGTRGCTTTPCPKTFVGVRLADGEPLWELPAELLEESRGLDARGIVAARRSGGTLLVSAFDLRLGFAPGSPPPAAVCGAAYSHRLETHNGTPPLVFRLESGDLPAGLSFEIPTGTLSGTPAGAPGSYTLKISVVDATGARAEASFTLTLGTGGAVPITSTRLGDGRYRLSVPDDGADVLWSPGGETTSAITVTAEHPAVYGVSVGTASGCRSMGSVVLGDTRPDFPGDLDADDRITLFDVVIHASLIVGNVTPGAAPFLSAREAADLDRDGDVDVLDPLFLMSRLM